MLLSRCPPYVYKRACMFQKSLLHNSFQALCPVPQQLLYLPVFLYWCSGLCSMQHGKQTWLSLVMTFTSFWSYLVLGQLFPWNLLIAWKLLLLTKPYKFRFPCFSSQCFRCLGVGASSYPSLFLVFQFIAFQRMQNRELVFIWDWCVKSFHCFQHVPNSESAGGCIGYSFPVPVF